MTNVIVQYDINHKVEFYNLWLMKWKGWIAFKFKFEGKLLGKKF
jgi:hypothetical protein